MNTLTKTRTRTRSSAKTKLNPAIDKEVEKAPSKGHRLPPMQRHLNHASPLTRFIAGWMQENGIGTVGALASAAGLNFSLLRDSMDRGFASTQLNSLREVVGKLRAIGCDVPGEVIVGLLEAPPSNVDDAEIISPKSPK